MNETANRHIEREQRLASERIATLGRYLLRPGTGVLLALLVLSGVFTSLSPYFLKLPNLQNIALQSAVNIITATGMTFVIGSSGIDLSVGSGIALTGVVMALGVKLGLPSIPAILVGLVAGAAIGSVNGLIIGRVRINPFIVTLAMEGVARALALIITGARPIYGMPPFFRSLGIGKIGPLPTATVLALSIAVIGYVLLGRTRFGRHVLAVGGNEEAARLYGVNVPRVKLKVYALAGVCYAIAAIIVTSRLNTAEPIAGYLAEMDAISATVIGGTAFVGGIATLPGTVMGALIIAVLRNGLTLLSVQPYYQQLTIGIVIVAAVFLDQLRRRKGEEV